MNKRRAWLLLASALVTVLVIRTTAPAPSARFAADAERLHNALIGGDYDLVSSRVIAVGPVDQAVLKRFLDGFVFPSLACSRGEGYEVLKPNREDISVKWRYPTTRGDFLDTGFTYERRGDKAYIWLPRLVTMTIGLRTFEAGVRPVEDQFRSDADRLRSIGFVGLEAKSGEIVTWEQVADKIAAFRARQEKNSEAARKAYSQ